MGDRVKRGSDWCWYNQDSNGVGTVTALRLWARDTDSVVTFDSVQVVWDTGGGNIYRFGFDGKYDVVVIERKKQQ